MIIERYLYREVLRTCAAVFAVIVLVYGADRFTRFLSDAAAGAVPPELVVQILALKLAEEVPMLLSLALYLAVLLSLGRLYKDSEIVAFEAAGVGVGRLSLGVFRVVAGFSLAGAALSLFVSPSLASMRGALLEEARHRAENQVFVPGRFKEFGIGDQVIYVEAMDYESGEMSNVFVRVRTPHRQYVLTSHAAHQVVRPASGVRYMVLENGYRYAGLPWDAKFSVTRFERHAVRIDAQPKGTIAGGRKTLATTALVNSGDPRHFAELQRRTAVRLLRRRVRPHPAGLRVPSGRRTRVVQRRMLALTGVEFDRCRPHDMRWLGTPCKALSRQKCVDVRPAYVNTNSESCL